jgi:hypothetical protein
MSKFGDALQAAERDLGLVDAEFATRREAGDNISHDYTLINNSFTGQKTFSSYINVSCYFGKGTIQENAALDRSKKHSKNINGAVGFVSIFIFLSNNSIF